MAQGAIFQGQPVVAGVLGFTMFAILFYLTGVAYFRAMRYRLSRTYWRGIRGGSNDPGFRYGLSYMWKSFVGWLPIFLLVPQVKLSKRLDLARDADRALDSVPGLILRSAR